MKGTKMKIVTALILCCALTACASAPREKPVATLDGSTVSEPTRLDIGSTPLSKFTHADLQSAAAYASANGYPARAAVWKAIDAQLKACEDALSSAGPQAPVTGAVGAATLFEIGAEAVGRGIPAAVKINCGAIVPPGL